MNVRKVFLILACIFSVIAVFIPFYTVTVQGTIGYTYLDEKASASLWGTYYGYIILASAVMIVLFALAGIKKGYVISSIVNIVASLWGLFNMTVSQDTNTAILRFTSKFANAYAGDGSNSMVNVEDGPAAFLLTFAAILILVTMLWNALNNEE